MSKGLSLTANPKERKISIWSAIRPQGGPTSASRPEKGKTRQAVPLGKAENLVNQQGILEGRRPTTTRWSQTVKLRNKKDRHGNVGRGK